MWINIQVHLLCREKKFQGWELGENSVFLSASSQRIEELSRHSLLTYTQATGRNAAPLPNGKRQPKTSNWQSDSNHTAMNASLHLFPLPRFFIPPIGPCAFQRAHIRSENTRCCCSEYAPNRYCYVCGVRCAFELSWCKTITTTTKTKSPNDIMAAYYEVNEANASVHWMHSDMCRIFSCRTPLVCRKARRSRHSFIHERHAIYVYTGAAQKPIWNR